MADDSLLGPVADDSLLGLVAPVWPDEVPCDGVPGELPSDDPPPVTVSDALVPAPLSEVHPPSSNTAAPATAITVVRMFRPSIDSHPSAASLPDPVQRCIGASRTNQTACGTDPVPLRTPGTGATSQRGVDAVRHWPALASVQAPIHLAADGSTPAAASLVPAQRFVCPAGPVWFGLLTDLTHPTLIVIWAIVVATAAYLNSHITRRVRFTDDIPTPMPRGAPTAQQVTSTTCQ